MNKKGRRVVQQDVADGRTARLMKSYLFPTATSILLYPSRVPLARGHGI